MKRVLLVMFTSGCLTEPMVEASVTSGSSSEDGTTFGVDDDGSSLSSTTAQTTQTVTTDAEGSSSGDESSDSESSTDESSSTSDDTSTGDVGGQPSEGVYAPCTLDDDSACTYPAAYCIASTGEMEEITPTGWCTQFCNEDADCPAAPTDGTAFAECNYDGPDLVCMLRCPDGLTCPAGMECIPQLWDNFGYFIDVCTTAYEEL
jgi:hypothetical protein